MKQVISLALFAAILFAGCQSNLTMRRMQARNPLAKNSVKTPTKFVDVWNTYAQSTPDGKAMRGIAGRIHFYSDAQKKKAVKVDGDVTVFLFDGEEDDPAHAKPLKVYRFKSDALPKHYAFKKPLGHGYDFFLPFDELGGEEKKLCVMTRFDDRLDENFFVLSQPVNTVLQGTRSPLQLGPTVLPEESVQQFLASNTVLGEARPKTANQAGQNAIQQVGFEQSVAKEAPPEQRAISTIVLNDSLTRRLARAPERMETSRTPPEPNPPAVPSLPETGRP